MRLEYLILVILALGFYETSIKSEIKEKKNREFVENNLEIGSKIITDKGIVGEVVKIDDEVVILITGSADNHSYIRLLKKEISNIIS
ncbi:preprotein translocase subunit YajC [Anaerococcus urinomassiliensis]|uniref:preprotein translocase subunit YajC n=1 Tax=Anaerococcus urinomassiliensis TaxID=1745712 RepID=UPI0009E27199|nr:preprotein translocase subunit YajC [Anaerococcus urinomassiliensis]